MESASDGKLHTVPEVMRILRCSRWLIYKMERAGELEVIRLTPKCVRVSDRSLQRFIDGRKGPK